MALGGEQGGNYADDASYTGADHFDFWNNNGSFLNTTIAGHGVSLIGLGRFSRFGQIPVS